MWRSALRRLACAHSTRTGTLVAATGLGGICISVTLSSATALCDAEVNAATATSRRTERVRDERRAPVGGVLAEFRTPQRCVTRLIAPLDGFFSKEVVVFGVPIRAHADVSDAALLIAADRLSRMLRPLPKPVLERLQRRGASFHIIGMAQGTSDLPEHAHMKGVPGGYTKEGSITLDQRTRGMGGLRSSCGEENLIDLDSDPRYAECDILTHEFAHCVMDVGLTPSMRQEIRDTHRKAVDQGLWRRPDGSLAYAGSNASEYFAELTMWYFGTHGEFVDRTTRSPPPGPGGLSTYDSLGFSLLASIYSGTNAALAEEDHIPAEGASPTAVLVSGCGRPEYNGTYIVDGVADGVPCYRKAGTACTIERGPWNGMTWGMNKEYGNFDYWLESSAAVPPTSGWKVDDAGAAGGRGVPPAPSMQVQYASSDAAAAEALAMAKAQSRTQYEGRPQQ